MFRPLRRSGVNKQSSARSFKRNARRTDVRNINRVMRGGIRL